MPVVADPKSSHDSHWGDLPILSDHSILEGGPLLQVVPKQSIVSLHAHIAIETFCTTNNVSSSLAKAKAVRKVFIRQFLVL